MTSIFSIFGEWSGNVRSTPTPNDCLRTVNVSREPAPCRLITMPSKTWIRRRWPSITWKCTRTVSPALNCGRFGRSWRCSMDSMRRFMERRPAGPVGNGSESPVQAIVGRSAERDPVRRPVGHDHRPDQVLARDRAPHARVARVAAVVAHHEVLTLRDVPLAGRAPAAAELHVLLLDQLPVDSQPAAVVGDGVAWEPDQAL